LFVFSSQKIHLEEEDVSIHQNYNLYVYGEEDLAEKYSKGKFKGLPILFIPGNAGSYKQGNNQHFKF